jgi:Ca2+-binding RTX toxin-like protein
VSSIVQDASGRSTLAMQDGPGSIGEFSVVNRAGQVLLLAGTAGAVQIGDAVDFAQTDVVTVSGERATLAELVARNDASAVGSGAGGSGSGGAGSAGGTGAATGTIRSVEADGRSVLLSTALLTANQTLWGSARADRLEGGTGGDAMDAGRGNDWLTGGEGADDLTGGAGSDVLVGGVGSDTLRGGDRNGASAAVDVDTYVFNLGDGFDSIMAKRNVAAPTDVIRFGAGITRADLRVGVSPAPYTPEVQLIDLAYSASDRVSLDFGADLQIAHVEFADGTRVSLGELITSSRPASTDGDDRMDGTRFDDALSGGAGNDMLDGRGGSDVLCGGAGEDTIDGRDGDDVLTGGSGDDVLTGGSGRNTYVFGADSGRDLVRVTSGETGLLQFESTLAALRASLLGADLVIADGAGSEVRLLGYGDDARVGANWQLQAAGASVGLGTWLGSAAPLYANADAARRQAFLDQQFADLRSVSQYYPGFLVNGNSGAAIPSSVQRTTAQLVSGEPFVHDDYLARALQTETIRRIVPEPIYQQVRTLQMGAPGGSITLYGTRADGTVGEDASSGFGGSWGRGPVTPVLGPSGEQIGYATLPTAPVNVTETRIVGWTSTVVEDIQRRTTDVARQATIAGTSGADRISGRALFRGQIDTGAGNDVIELRSAPIGPYESWEGDRSDWAPLQREQQLRFENAPYQPHGMGAWIDAGSGDDRVLGTDGSDVIVGGTGNDWLDGQAGADTYLIGDDGGHDRIADLAAFDWGGPESRDQYYGIYGGDLAHPNRDMVEFDASVSIDRLSYRWEMVVSNGLWVRMLKLSHGGREFLDIDYPYADAPTDRSVSHGGIEQFRFADGSTFTTQALIARLDALAIGPGSDSGTGSGTGSDAGAGASGGSGSGGGAGGGSGGTSGSAGGSAGSGGTGTGGSTTTPAGDDTPPLAAYRLGDGRRTIGADAGTDTLRFGAGITLDRLAIRPAAAGASTFITVLGDNGNERTDHGVDLHPASGIRQVSLADGSVLSLDTLRITARTLSGTRRDDLLRGDRRDDTVRGDRGTDMIFGRSGHDTLDGGDGNDLLVGEGGDDRLVGGKGVDVLIGGAGNDRIESGAGGGVIAFNRGDGADTAVCSARDKTALSVGGGIRYDDIRLQRSGGDLVIDFGAGDRMTIADWYRSRNARGLTTLQVVTAASSDFDTTSTSRLRQRPVVSFDFMALVRRFDAARSRDSALTSWAVADSLDAVWKKPAGTGTALGGEFAYRYATTGQAEPTDPVALRRPLAALSAGGGQPFAPVRAVDPWQAMQASLAVSTTASAAMSAPVTASAQAPLAGLSWGALLAGSSTTSTPSRRPNEELA